MTRLGLYQEALILACEYIRKHSPIDCPIRETGTGCIQGLDIWSSDVEVVSDALMECHKKYTPAGCWQKYFMDKTVKPLKEKQ